MSKIDYKSPKFTDIPDAKLIRAGEKRLSLFTEFPEPPDFAPALDAVEGLDAEGESFLDPIRYITSQIPIDLGIALSPLFLFLDFDEIPLLQLADSPLSAIIREAFIHSGDASLLLGCANLVAACSCLSRACLSKFINSGLHRSLFACLPRLPLLDSLDTIVAVLDALTIIWKRLSWARLTIALDPEELDELFSLLSPLAPALNVPFVRLLHSLLSYAPLDAAQATRVYSVICAILSISFNVNAEAIGDVVQAQLGQMAEIAFLLHQNRGGITVSRYDIFEGVVRSVHLLRPSTITQLLKLFDKCAEYCDERRTAQFLRKLPCDDLIELLPQVGDDPRLIESILNILSLVIGRQCAKPKHIVEFILPKIIELILESMGEDEFRLKQAGIRFVHAVVGTLSWRVLPCDAFRVYMIAISGFMPSQSLQECIWFLDCLLSALRVDVPEFADYVMRVCDELNIWEIFEEILREDIVVSALCDRIEAARSCREEDMS
jgi:hypothetical protein